MSNKLSPEYWVAGFIKSATNGRIVSPRFRRLLTLIIIPIWVGSLIFSVPQYIQAFKAIPKYNALKRLERTGLGLDYDDNNCYGGHVHRSWINDGESNHQCCFNSQFWIYMGLENPDHRDSVTGLVSLAKLKQEIELEKFLSLPFLILLFAIAPWVILRIIYWVKDAEKAKDDD